ncbi:hypothetical protein EGD00_08180 [Pectobacterium carotovorum subsp. carotovorum]|nr:hypothetical protein EGD00_08180 [Pectobacterium carotovorum subsp. carotovorum]
MQELTKNIVELKKEIDADISALMKGGGAQYGSSNIVMNPYDFMRKIFPFYQGDVKETVEDSLVSPALVIGGTYRDYEHVTVDKNYLNDINDASLQGIDKPIYYKFGDFPLHIAWEGKNRVSIFKKHGVDIVCKECLTTYPSSGSLLIHKARFRKNVYFLSCKDEKFIHRESNYEQIYFPDYVLPLLKRYGVKEGRPIFKPFSVQSYKQIIAEFSLYLLKD